MYDEPPRITKQNIKRNTTLSVASHGKCIATSDEREAEKTTSARMHGVASDYQTLASCDKNFTFVE